MLMPPSYEQPINTLSHPTSHPPSLQPTLTPTDIKRGAMLMPPSYEQPMDEIRKRLQSYKYGQRWVNTPS